MKFEKTLAALAVASALAFTGAAGAEPKGGTPKDAWITGKVETMFLLNPHLNNFKIDTEVTEGVVRLMGKVESDIDRDLAGELAKGVDGVVSVDNDLMIAPNSRSRAAAGSDADRPFSVWVDDATTTAAIKSKLLANSNTEGMEIDVDTRGDVVTLSGEVESSEEKQLAEQIARNTGDVKDVHNRLVVRAN